MNIGMHVSFQIIVLSGYMPKSGIAGSYGSSNFSLLRNLHTVFHSGCTNSFPSTVQEGSFFSTLLQHLFICKLSDDGHSDWCEVVPHFSFDLYFSNNSDDEHLFICQLAICMSPLEKCLFRSSAHLQIALFNIFYLVLQCLFSMKYMSHLCDKTAPFQNNSSPPQ